ncbi:hypothetical protein ACHAWF_003402, partial [Thalassiosira exigua]
TKNNQDNMAIGSANIVYIIAEAGTGKSFSGDYLDVVHSFKHVDGDIVLKNSHLPEYRELSKNLLMVFMAREKATTTGDANDCIESEHLWGPHYDELARLTLEAAKDHEKVVLTHATPKNAERDRIVKKLVDGGVPRENITLIQLTIDLDVKYRGLYYRTLVQGGVDAGVMTMEDVCKSWGWEFEGEMTADKFVECSKKFPSYFKGSEMSFQTRSDATKVDVSGRDITHCDNLDAALGLVRSVDWSYENIVNKVKPLDEQRDRDMVANEIGRKVLPELMAEIESEQNPDAAKKEDEAKILTEAMKKRRSSLFQADLINGRLLSSLTVTDDDEVKKRRSTLIFKGKLDLGDLEE